MLGKNMIRGEIFVLFACISFFPKFSVIWLYCIYNENKYLERK